MQNLDCKTLKTGELAKLAGVSADTLHHYEKMGVLPPPRRRESGYRDYPPEALDRVLLVRRALGIGFTLAELAPILAAKDAGEAPCRQVIALVAEKLCEVEERICALTALRGQLEEALSDWRCRIQNTPAGEQARLLELLPPNRVSSRRNSRKGLLTGKPKEKQ